MHVLKGLLDHRTQLQQRKCRGPITEGPEHNPMVIRA